MGETSQRSQNDPPSFGEANSFLCLDALQIERIISIVLPDTFPDGNPISKIFKKPVHEEKRVEFKAVGTVCK